MSDTQETAARILKHLDESRTAKSALRQQWLENVAFASGEQWLDYDRYSTRFYQPDSPHWRVRLTFNYLRPIMQTWLALMTKETPVWAVAPATIDEADRAAARACESLLDYIYRTHDIGELVEEALMWAATCGVGFIKTFWNWSKGAEHKIGEEIDENGQKVDVFHRPGAIDFTVVSPFELHPNPGAKNLKDAQWIIHEYLMHIDQARMTWPEYADEFRADAETEPIYTSARKPGSSNVNDDQVRIVEWWMKPTLKHQKGHFAVVANSDTIEQSALPYGEEAGLPFVGFHVYKELRYFWSQSLVGDLKDIQTQVNRLISGCIEDLNTCGRPKYVADKTTGLQKTSITKEPGEVIYKNPGTTFQSVPGTPPTPITLSLFDTAKQGMNEIAGVYEVAMGGGQTGITSARQLAFANELHNTKFGPHIRMEERAVTRVGIYALRVIHEVNPPPLTLKILGRNRVADVVAFHSSQIRTYDVQVLGGSMRPTNQALKVDLLMEAWQLGLIQDRRKVLKLMNLDNLEDVRGSQDKATAKAKANIERIKRGIQPMMPPIDVMTEESLMAHREAVYGFVEDAEYDDLPEMQKMAIIGYLRAIDQGLMAFQGMPPSQWAAPQQGGVVAPSAQGINPTAEAGPAAASQGVDREADKMPTIGSQMAGTPA